MQTAMIITVWIIFTAACITPFFKTYWSHHDHSDPINTEITRCYCLRLGRMYYTDTPLGYTFDAHRAYRLTIEEASDLKQLKAFSDYSLESIPSISLL